MKDKTTATEERSDREIIQDFINEERVTEEEKEGFLDGMLNQLGEVEVGNIEMANVQDVIEEIDETVETTTPKIKDFPLVSKSGMNVTKGIGNFFSSLKSPSGGIAILLGLIIFIVFAIKKVEGKETTRLGLLFQSFLTNTELEGFETKNKSASETVGEAVGNKVIENAENGTVPIWGTIVAPILGGMVQE